MSPPPLRNFSGEARVGRSERSFVWRGGHTIAGPLDIFPTSPNNYIRQPACVCGSSDAPTAIADPRRSQSFFRWLAVLPSARLAVAGLLPVAAGPRCRQRDGWTCLWTGFLDPLQLGWSLRASLLRLDALPRQLHACAHVSKVAPGAPSRFVRLRAPRCSGHPRSWMPRLDALPRRLHARARATEATSGHPRSWMPRLDALPRRLHACARASAPQLKACSAQPSLRFLV